MDDNNAKCRQACARKDSQLARLPFNGILREAGQLLHGLTPELQAAYGQ